MVHISGEVYFVKWFDAQIGNFKSDSDNTDVIKRMKTVVSSSMKLNCLLAMILSLILSGSVILGHLLIFLFYSLWANKHSFLQDFASRNNLTLTLLRMCNKPIKNGTMENLSTSTNNKSVAHNF